MFGPADIFASGLGRVTVAKGVTALGPASCCLSSLWWPAAWGQVVPPHDALFVSKAALLQGAAYVTDLGAHTCFLSQKRLFSSISLIELTLETSYDSPQVALSKKPFLGLD